MFKGKIAEMKSKMVDKEMYMHLVDEYTNDPVASLGLELECGGGYGHLDL